MSQINDATRAYLLAFGKDFKPKDNDFTWPSSIPADFDVCGVKFFTCNADGTAEVLINTEKYDTMAYNISFSGDWANVRVTNITIVGGYLQFVYSNFALLPELRSLTLRDISSITEIVSVAWPSMTALESLTLRNTGLCGMLPERLPPNLTSLDLSRNRFVGPVPYSWLGRTFRSFDVSGNKLCGSVPNAWADTSMQPVLAAATDAQQCTAAAVRQWCDKYTAPKTDRVDPSDATAQFCDTLRARWPDKTPGTFCASPHFRCTWEGTAINATGALGSDPLEIPDFSTLSVDWSQVRVTSMDLSANPALGGPLPKEWGALTALTSLDLSNTSVSGTLPPEWSGMTAVTALRLSNTSVGGPLPQLWTTLPSIKSLYLDHTRLCGRLPESLPSTIEYAIFTGAHFIGPIPDGWVVSSNRVLRVDVTGNDICGCFPSSMNSSGFHLDSALTDSATCTTDNACTPERLEQTCPLSAGGEAPTATSSTTSSTPDPAPESSSTTSSTPDPVVDPTSTTSTTTSSTPDPVAGPSTSTTSTTSSTAVPVAPTPGTSAALPRHTHNFCTFVLRKLGLMEEPSSTRADTATTAAATTVLPADADYCVTGNYVSCGTDGSVLITINGVFTTGAGVAMPNFAELDIDWPGATVTSIDMSNNPAMTGAVPAEWGRLTGLRSVDLSTTALSGRLPAEWSGMSSLQSLKISGAQLSGALPDTWQAMSALNTLDLSNNRLCGAVPETFLPPSARSLDLHGNLLVGPVPASWSRQQFTQFDVSSNLLCGCVPNTFTSLITPQALETAPAHCDPANVCSPASVAQVCEGYVTTPSSEISSGGGDGLSGGAIAGIVVGVVGGVALLLVVIGLLVWLLCCRKSRSGAQEGGRRKSPVDDDSNEPFDSASGSKEPYTVSPHG